MMRVKVDNVVEGLLQDEAAKTAAMTSRLF